MTEIRSILLHLDASAASAARLVLARALAARHGARVTALFAVRRDPSQAAFAYSASAALQAVEDRVMPVDSERDRLRALLAEGDPECDWCDVVGDSVVHAFVAESAYADLIVLGPPAWPDDAGAPPPGLAESVIVQSGAPTLVVPHPHRHDTVGERALVAWNGSPPSARALRAALPMLRRAAEVHVASWSRQPPLAPFSRLDIADWLRRHGVPARVHAHPVMPQVADALRDEVLRLGCDLVVMGCYGHSRLREQVFGGVTRALLGRLPAPILMSH